jgi:hypothetical protein
MDLTLSITYFPSISAKVDACDSLFEKTHDSASSLRNATKGPPPNDFPLPDIVGITTEYERLRIWAANAGAFR